MNVIERCRLYLNYKDKIAFVQDLKNKIIAAQDAGDEAFKSGAGEAAYTVADKAGWLLVDELTDAMKAAENAANECYKLLRENAFDLSDYQSCCAYGVDDKKRVKVIFLDERVMYGLIYPWVYDNPQEMWLVCDDGTEIDLNRGWEVQDVEFV